MTAPVLVTGGTGTLGSLVVPRLQAAGRPVRVMSRHPHEPADGVAYVVGDLETGDGLDDALAGVETVVNCAGGARGDDAKAANLVRAATRAGVRHVVHVSVVGADRIPVASAVDRAMLGYFTSKRGAEEEIARSGLGWTTLRATQFHDLVLLVAQSMAKLPVLPVPAGFRVQPVDAAAVADRLTELALGTPAGLAPDVAGPRVYTLADLVRTYLEATHRHRPILPLRIPGGAARAVRDGAILAPGRAAGGRTWEDFLAERVAA
jgi:uncharacterized protein YbjT (DUF2867 family)